MAEKKDDNKIYVRLKDTNSVFHDVNKSIKVTGKLPVLVEKSERVKAALKGGHLVEVSKTDAEKEIATAKKPTPAAASTDDKGETGEKGDGKGEGKGDEAKPLAKMNLAELQAECDTRAIKYEDVDTKAILKAKIEDFDAELEKK